MRLYSVFLKWVFFINNKNQRDWIDMMSLDKYCYSWNCVANIKIFIRRTINFDSGSEFTDKGHICKFATKAFSLRYATCATIIMAYYNFSVITNCNDYKLQWRCTGRRLTFLRIQFRPSRRLFFFSIDRFGIYFAPNSLQMQVF